MHAVLAAHSERSHASAVMISSCPPPCFATPLEAAAAAGLTIIPGDVAEAEAAEEVGKAADMAIVLLGLSVRLRPPAIPTLTPSSPSS